MNITFYSNATCLYEYKGYRLLADPWLTETAFEGAWIHETPLKTKPQDLLDVDGLMISHPHGDHFDKQTLKFFRRDIPILTIKDKASLCERLIKNEGFSNVIAVPDNRSVEMGPFKCTMFEAFCKHPYFDSEMPNPIDSACLIRADSIYVLNANDNTFSVEAAKKFYAEYGSVSVAQLNYNGASFYPACFINLNHEEKLAECERLINRNLAHLAEISSILKPAWTHPFAGAFRLNKHLDHLNQYLGVTSAENAVKYLTDEGLKAFSLKELESFDVR